MTVTIEVPSNLEAVLKAQANAHGVDAADYVRDILLRDLALAPDDQRGGPPFKTGRGVLAKYGPAPSAEEIDANRADMFQHFGEDF